MFDDVDMARVNTKAEREQAEQRRMTAARWFAEHVSQAEIARRLQVTPTSVCRWHKAWLAEGVDGLRSHGAPGNPPLLDQRQCAELVDILHEGPRAAGLPGDGWTLNRIATVIWRRFGVRYRYPSVVWNLLRRLGFTAQRPARRALERDEAAITAWRAQTWQRLVEPPAPAERGSVAPTSPASI